MSNGGNSRKFCKFKGFALNLLFTVVVATSNYGATTHLKRLNPRPILSFLGR